MTTFAINFNLNLTHHHLNHPSPNYTTLTINGVEVVEVQCPECHLILSRERADLPD